MNVRDYSPEILVNELLVAQRQIDARTLDLGKALMVNPPDFQAQFAELKSAYEPFDAIKAEILRRLGAAQMPHSEPV
jgi:hypothetical protein